MSKLLSFAQLAGQFQRVKVGTLLWLRKSKTNKAGTAPIHLRIFIGTDRVEHSCNIRVAPEEWDAPNGRILGKGKLVQQQNEQLQLLKAHVTELVNLMKATGRKISISSIRRELIAPTVGKSPCFIDLCQRMADSYKESNYSYYEGAAAAVGALKRWNGIDKDGEHRALPVDEFTPKRAAEFYAWMQSGSGCVKIVTANQRVSRLVALFRLAAEYEEVEISENPFRALRKKKADVATARLHLSHEQLALLREAELQPKRALARDIYLTQYYLHGSRVGVVLELRWAQVGATQVQFKAEKSGPRKVVDISPELARVLARHRPAQVEGNALVFPYLPANFFDLSHSERHRVRSTTTNSLNFHLGRIAKQLGIEGVLSSHTARHTLAAHAAQLGGLDVAQGMLGHTSQAQTAHYAGPLHNEGLAQVERALYGGGAEPVPPPAPAPPSPPDEGGKVIPLFGRAA